MTRLTRRVAVSALIPLTAAALAACSGSDKNDQASSSSATSSSSASATPSTSTAPAMKPDVKKVNDIFGTLVPNNVWTNFDSCTSIGRSTSAYECSGPDVGQFQFSQSQSKAASSTQALTELRSSRVLQDKDNKIIGWTTTGATSVITIVDNKNGTVAQKMVGADGTDPEQEIKRLGLVQQDATPSSQTGEPSPSAPATPSPEKKN